jgi:hypothetical protein
MQPVDVRLREDLATVADDAEPLGVSLESLLAKLKRRVDARPSAPRPGPPRL